MLANHQSFSETVTAWLQVVQMDLKQVRNNLDGPEPTLRGASYHCQQAVEKIIKCLLIIHNIRPPKWHDIEKLLMLLPDEDKYKTQLTGYVDLTVYATAGRYPDDGWDEDDLSESEVRIWLAEFSRIEAELRQQFTQTP